MKKKILGLAAIALVAATITGGTFAYLQSQTAEKTNTFTMGEGVTAEIAEPNWDGSLFTNGNEGLRGDDFDTGKKAAENFAPGMDIAKNPIVKNTSTKTAVYAAVKITYGEVGSYAALSKFADIDFNSTNWTLNADKTVAYYNTALAAGKMAEPVFNKVTIKESATTGTNTDSDMKNFNITVQGFICQTTDVDGVSGPMQTLNKVFGDTLTK